MANEGDKRSLPLCFSIFLYLPLIVIFCCLWATVVFPTFGFFHVNILYNPLFLHFLFSLLCINRKLSCGRVQRSESIPINRLVSGCEGMRALDRAIEATVDKIGRFNGKDATSYLEAYRAEMQMRDIPEDRWLTGFPRS